MSRQELRENLGQFKVQLFLETKTRALAPPRAFELCQGLRHCPISWFSEFWDGEWILDGYPFHLLQREVFVFLPTGCSEYGKKVSGFFCFFFCHMDSTLSYHQGYIYICTHFPLYLCYIISITMFLGRATKHT